MKRICSLAVCVCLLLMWTASAAQGADLATGKVTVSSATASLFSSSVHYVATASTTCAKGISAMGIYTAPYQRAYLVRGSKLDTTLKLAPGKYNTVVQSWDNCGHSAKAYVPVTIQSATVQPPPVKPPLVQPPTTTLAAQTGNNTSAANSFLKQSNGNLGAGNVSKVDIHSLLYPAATTDIYAELQPWFGDKRHMQVGYISWDTVQVDKQLNDMLSRGVMGVVIDWYGPADGTEPTTLAWLAAAQNHPGFKVMIMIDKGAVTLCSTTRRRRRTRP